MNFQLSEDQRAFADMASGLFADYCGDEQLREICPDSPGPCAHWRQPVWNAAQAGESPCRRACWDGRTDRPPGRAGFRAT